MLTQGGSHNRVAQSAGVHLVFARLHQGAEAFNLARPFGATRGLRHGDELVLTSQFDLIAGALGLLAGGAYANACF